MDLIAPKEHILFGIQDFSDDYCELRIDYAWDPAVEFKLHTESINEDFDKMVEKYGDHKNLLQKSTLCMEFNGKIQEVLDIIPVSQAQEFFNRFPIICINYQIDTICNRQLVQYFGGSCSSMIVMQRMRSEPYKYPTYHSLKKCVHKFCTYFVAKDRAFYRRREAIIGMWL